MEEVAVEFLYEGTKTIIQSNSKEKMKDIMNKILIKLNKTKDRIYFLYGGSKLNEELSFEEVATLKTKNKKKCV